MEFEEVVALHTDLTAESSHIHLILRPPPLSRQLSLGEPLELTSLALAVNAGSCASH